MSIARRSQAKSYLPSSGSHRPHTNSPMRTTLMPAATMRLASISQRDSGASAVPARSEEHTSELQSRQYLVCRLLLEKKKTQFPPFRELRHRSKSTAVHA